MLEDVWRAAEPAERDFFQGLVHVAVAWYQAGRGNPVGCERPLQVETPTLDCVDGAAAMRESDVGVAGADHAQRTFRHVVEPRDADEFSVGHRRRPYHRPLIT